MYWLKSALHAAAFSGCGLLLVASSRAQQPQKSPAALVDAGRVVFQANCAFCHGRDAAGGESGPDLTRSKLVTSDSGGDKILMVVENGRPDKGMPAFKLPQDQLSALVAFIHNQANQTAGRKGGRRGVDPEDFSTGNVALGKAYFNGAGGCSGCHSPTGDLAGIASKHQGLELVRRMLAPGPGHRKLTVTLPSGETITGDLAYHDEFTVAMRDSKGSYRSWSVKNVHYTITYPTQAHVDLFPKYTDDDIHNLMAYLQTLR